MPANPPPPSDRPAEPGATPPPAGTAPAPPGAASGRTGGGPATALAAPPPSGPRPQPGMPVVAPLFGPWPDPSLSGRRWPGPGGPASAATVVAVLVAGVVAALSVPLDRPGVGWAIAAAAGVL